MARKKLLFVGFGKLASRAASMFQADGWQVTALARSPRVVGNMMFIQGSVTDPAVAERLAKETFDLVVITLSPDGRDVQAYRQAYFDNVQFLVDLWTENHAPSKVLYVSSTRVYGETNGAWLDETSACQPDSAQGQILLDTERLLLDSVVASTVVRFSGIYSAERDYLLRQVLAGRLDGEHYSNRIHEHDGAAILLHLAQRWSEEGTLEDLYLATDSLPEKSGQVKHWMAERLREKGIEIHAQAGETASMGSKRLSNQRLLASGYAFTYPDYLAGYGHIIREYTA